MEFLIESGQSIPVEIRRRKGTRHLKLSLGFQNQIVASAPWHSSDRSISKFIEKQRVWLEAQIAQAPRALGLLEWFHANPYVSASGERIEVRIERKDGGRREYRFELGGAVLVFRLPEVTEGALRKLVRDFSRDALTCRVYFHSKRLGLDFGSLTVRDQASRWGSCSVRRGISLNWRLILLHPGLQDYIILHELAHLTEMNHSQRFWRLLDEYDPHRVEHEAELSAISSEFMRIARG